MKILMERAEGHTWECVRREVTSWDEADLVGLQWAFTAPRDGSYHKVDVWVTDEAGVKRYFRWDMINSMWCDGYQRPSAVWGHYQRYWQGKVAT